MLTAHDHALDIGRMIAQQSEDERKIEKQKRFWEKQAAAQQRMMQEVRDQKLRGLRS